jgi:hypothetical protein
MKEHALIKDFAFKKPDLTCRYYQLPYVIIYQDGTACQVAKNRDLLILTATLNFFAIVDGVGVELLHSWRY